MCMWFGFNPAVNVCHFSTLLTLSVFAGATSTSPKFDLFFGITRLCQLMLNNNPKGQIILSTPNSHGGFFFLLTIQFPNFDFNHNIHFVA